MAARSRPAGARRRHDALLEAFYDVGAAPPPGADRPRFYIERDRRILDIARLLATGWPRTCYLERSRHGDDLIFGTAALIPSVRKTSPTIRHAVEQALRAWIGRHGDRAGAALFAFEQARAGVLEGTRAPTAGERRELAARGVTQARLLDVGFDVLSLIGSLDFLLARNAPSAFVRGLEPMGDPMTVAFYRRGNSVVAAPLMDAV